MKVFSGGGAFQKVSVPIEQGLGVGVSYLLCEPLAENGELIFDEASGDILLECFEKTL